MPFHIFRCGKRSHVVTVGHHGICQHQRLLEFRDSGFVHTIFKILTKIALLHRRDRLVKRCLCKEELRRGEGGGAGEMRWSI
jgi:hypothetical protein